MHNNKFTNNTLILLTLFCCLSLPLAGRAAVYVIHHPDLASEDFSSRNLVRIYAMQKRVWSDGTPVTVYTLPKTSPTHRAFVTGYLRMQPYQLDRLWHRTVFSGTGVMPEEVSSVDEMLRRVAATPGAVGYISRSDSGELPEGVSRVVAND
ncbi:hypothetical protein [Pseudomaricurvus sp. HS19]|uniref:hypothetical protein n=1 Tax=Pseudomaricurvus sp. HS19 TaxID=2692626 RepID=UPI00136CF70D|nr:hypothetical protein [Pseudomaricurvus sp. HS19]MYM63625.1 hypothetical protein [Pseudomaricurvus sp. HS19]